MPKLCALAIAKGHPLVLVALLAVAIGVVVYQLVKQKKRKILIYSNSSARGSGGGDASSEGQFEGVFYYDPETKSIFYVPLSNSSDNNLRIYNLDSSNPPDSGSSNQPDLDSSNQSDSGSSNPPYSSSSYQPDSDSSNQPDSDSSTQRDSAISIHSNSVSSSWSHVSNAPFIDSGSSVDTVLSGDSELCRGCEQNPVNTHMQPCNHHYMCSDCAMRIFRLFKKCKVCRARIERIVVED